MKILDIVSVVESEDLDEKKKKMSGVDALRQQQIMPLAGQTSAPPQQPAATPNQPASTQQQAEKPEPTWGKTASGHIKNLGQAGASLAKQTGRVGTQVAKQAGKIGTAAVKGAGDMVGAATTGIGGAIGGFARGLKAGYKGQGLGAALPKNDIKQDPKAGGVQGQQAQQNVAQDIAGIDNELAGLKSMINRLNQRMDAMSGSDPKLAAFPKGGQQATG